MSDVQPAAESGESTTTSRITDHRTTAVVLVVAVLTVVGVGMWAERQLEQHLQRHTRDELQALLRASTRSLELWASHKESTAQRVASDPAVKKGVLELAALPSAEELRDSETRTRIEERLSALVADPQLLEYRLVDQKGVVLASSRAELVGTETASDKELARVLAQDITVVRPPERGRGDEVRVMVAAPIWRDKKRIVGAVVLAIGVEHFSDGLKVARAGRSGETYAFDSRGRMLSPSRFEDQLRNIGLLQGADSAVLNLELRDPGANLVAGETASASRADQPFTRMAEDALAGGSGYDVEGYRDYRGVSVIGAWAWLDKYEVGIATELNTAEAFEVRDSLRHGLFVLVAVLALAMLALVGGTMVMTRLRRRSRRAEQAVRKLGQYRLEQKLGEGGMGAVFKASHSFLRRPSAIKLMKGPVSALDVDRFVLEAQACSQLSHPNTIAVFDFGKTAGGEFYYAMEFLDGMDLDALVMRHGPMSAARAIHFLVQACGSLAEAHRKGLIHRDIKPSNVIACERGGTLDTAKVMDFGLVKEVAGSDQLTKKGMLCGTPLFLSPELARGGEASAASDIYALGITAFFLVTGNFPIEGENPRAILNAHVENEPDLINDHVEGVAPDFERVVLRCLAKDPKRRPPNMAALADLLRACEDHGGWSQADAVAFWDGAKEGAAASDREPLGARDTVAVAR